MNERREELRSETKKVFDALNHYCLVVKEKGEDSQAEVTARNRFDRAVGDYVHVYLGEPRVDASA